MKFIKNYLVEILLIIVIFMLLGIYAICGYYYFGIYEKKQVTVSTYEEPIAEVIESPEESVKMHVDIKGAVQNPGVYEINKNTIINEVILLAGGFNSNAYTKNINLSKKLVDETVIYVYTKYEYSLLSKPEPKEECVCPEPEITTCIESGSSIIENSKENHEESSDEINTTLININTASQEELMSLNGIGEAKAKSIIEYRISNGNFQSIENIKNVSGISDNVYEKIKDYITV